MLYNLKKLQDLYDANYRIRDYSPFEDPDLTYQEFVLILTIISHLPIDDFVYTEEIDIDKIYSMDPDFYLKFWHEKCLSHFFKPILFTETDWYKVFVDRAHLSKPNNISYEEPGTYPIKCYSINSHNTSPYKELWEEQEKQDKLNNN